MTEPPEPLPPEAEDALRDSIAEFGIVVPVVCDGDGAPIEGRHRARIAGEQGIAYTTKTATLADDDSRAKLNRRLNDHNRLDLFQRRKMVAHLDGLSHSGRAIARALRMGKHTVTRDLALYRDDTPLHVVTPRPVPETAPSSAQASRFVSSLAELVSLSTALGGHTDLSAVLTPEDARRWQPSVSRALSSVRALQNRMKEYTK